MKPLRANNSDLKPGDTVIPSYFYGHKNIEFIVTEYDVTCGEIVRNNGDGGKVVNLDDCKVISV